MKEGTCLYTEKDLERITAQQTRRYVFLGIPAFLMLAGVVVSFVVRIQWLTIALTILLGAYAIFCYGLFLSPVVCYRRHIGDALHGRTRQLTGQFKDMEEAPVWREGVQYYPMLLSVGDMEDQEDDRLFYFDANLPRPDWKIGDTLILTSHDKSVTAWQRA